MLEVAKVMVADLSNVHTGGVMIAESDAIDWDRAAQLIWSEDLVQDNTLLCRMKIGE